MKLENKVAIITGSTRGIGRATAELFAKEGAKVVVVGTKEELGKEVAEEIKAAGGEAIFCKTDVTSDESLENLVKTTLDAFGKIDILVNNAGVGGTTANMNQITMDEWNTVLATNLTAPFVLCKKVIPIMEEQGAGTKIYGIGSSMKAIALQDYGKTQGLVVLDGYEIGYKSVEEIAKKIKNRLYKMESHETEVKIMDQETPFLDDDKERFLYSYE